jgi:hypothetical protein
MLIAEHHLYGLDRFLDDDLDDEAALRLELDRVS